jgi:hypothetical protein
MLWDKYQAAFCMQWIFIANNIATCQKLVTLCQGNLSVKAFWLHFKVLANRSGLSKVDLLERFKASVNKDLLMTMAMVHLDNKSLTTWTCATIELNLICLCCLGWHTAQEREQEQERARERGGGTCTCKCSR